QQARCGRGRAPGRGAILFAMTDASPAGAPAKERSLQCRGRMARPRLLHPLLGLALVASAAVPGLAATLRGDESGFPPAPIWGADVRTLAFVPGAPALVLAGTSAGQVYLSRNAGATWENAGSALPFPGWVVGALRFDPNRKARLWVALWGIWGSGQVAFSDDL